MSNEYDYIIVGQGLAGTCLAYELLERGKKILVFDASDLPSSSKVAGGLFNPITGKNMVLTWKAQELFSFLTDFYEQLGKKLGARIIHYMPLYRPFSHNYELNDWQGKSSDNRYNSFIEFITEKPFNNHFIKNDLGGIMLKQTGYLDTKLMLNKFRSLLRAQDIIREEQFLYEKLNFNKEKIVYNEYSAKKVIFCDGSEGFRNHFVDKVRFHKVKGEVLRLQINYETDFILNKNGFILPRDGYYLAGSNYSLNDTTWKPTDLGREEILEKIEKILKIDYKVVDHVAGIRPTSHDRRPVIGLLPDKPNIGVFNGLGTKGVSLAPYFANQFAKHLIHGVELDAEVQIGRYFN